MSLNGSVNANVLRGKITKLHVNTVIALAEIKLPASAWKGEESPYSQVVSLTGVGEKSMVNLQPSVEQLKIFQDKEIAFSTENDGGVVTVYVFGDKPMNDYNIQATITEVAV